MVSNAVGCCMPFGTCGPDEPSSRESHSAAVSSAAPTCGLAPCPTLRAVERSPSVLRPPSPLPLLLPSALSPHTEREPARAAGRSRSVNRSSAVCTLRSATGTGTAGAAQRARGCCTPVPNSAPFLSESSPVARSKFITGWVRILRLLTDVNMMMSSEQANFSTDGRKMQRLEGVEAL